jgi:hypothetical protein
MELESEAMNKEGGARGQFCSIYTERLQKPLFQLSFTVRYPHHRSGWPFALRCLDGLLGDFGGLPWLDPAIEKTFAGDRPLAHREAWFGFLHCARGVPEHFDARKSPLHFFGSEAWIESKESCLGLFVLAPSMVDWARELSGAPVTALWHPAEFVEPGFSMDRYRQAGRPVVQVGWWLRRLASIHFLPVERQRKRLLIPQMGENLRRFEDCLEAERVRTGAPQVDSWNAQINARIDDTAYDEMLSHSVVFADLYDAGACNAVIECMVRGTPILVNRLPALEDYLGLRYPLFYESLEEAGVLARSDERVEEAHRYLRGLDLGRLRGEAFRRDLSLAALSLPTSP